MNQENHLVYIHVILTINHTVFGSGALPGKMFVWIIENNKIDAYFRLGLVK